MEDIPVVPYEEAVGDIIADMVLATNNAMADEEHMQEPNEEMLKLRAIMNVADCALSQLFQIAMHEELDFTEIAKRKGLERLRKMVYDPPDNFEETVNVIIERYVTYLKQQMN